MLHINKKDYVIFFLQPSPTSRKRNSSHPRDSDQQRGWSGNSPHDRYRVGDITSCKYSLSLWMPIFCRHSLWMCDRYPPQRFIPSLRRWGCRVVGFRKLYNFATTWISFRGGERLQGQTGGCVTGRTRTLDRYQGSSESYDDQVESEDHGFVLEPLNLTILLLKIYLQLLGLTLNPKHRKLV
jgi:hypothetical protein